jgi:hypothetical protein
MTRIAPARVLRSIRALKIVTQCKLHHSRCSLNTRKVSKRRNGTAELRVEEGRVIGITREMLSIGYVEGLAANCEFVLLTPGHVERLVETCIQRNKSRVAENISGACLTWLRTSETVVDSFRIRE